MELETLQFLIDAQRLGSFAAVAREHDRAPSSVSRAIAGLEEALGFVVFQRGTRALQLTEAGQVYLDRIEPLVAELTGAHLAAGDVGGEVTGRLRITAPVTFGQLNLVPLIPEFSRHYPDLSLDVLLTDATVDIEGERFDAALRLGVLAESSLAARKLCAMNLMVCASPEYARRAGRPEHPDALAEHSCLLLPFAGYRDRWRYRLPSGEEGMVTVTGSCTISNVRALASCAEAGMGVVMLPSWAVVPAIRAGSLENLFPNTAFTASDFDAGVWLVYARGRYLPRKTRVLIDYLVDRFADGPPAETL